MTEPSVAASTSDRFVLSAVELDVLWEWLGLGQTPPALLLPSPGRTHTERGRIVRGAWCALRRRGLAGGRGAAAGLTRLVLALSAPTEQLELRRWHRPGTSPLQRRRPRGETRPPPDARSCTDTGTRIDTRALATRQAGAAFGSVAVREHDTVTIAATTGPARALLDVLPPAPRGTGHSLTLPSAQLDAVVRLMAASASPERQPTGPGRPENADDAERAAAITTGAVAGAQVSVLVTDAWGAARRARHLHVLDTATGRYLASSAPAADGTEWTTLAPAGPGQVLDRTRELMAEARGDPGAAVSWWVPG